MIQIQKIFPFNREAYYLRLRSVCYIYLDHFLAESEQQWKEDITQDFLFDFFQTDLIKKAPYQSFNHLLLFFERGVERYLLKYRLRQAQKDTILNFFDSYHSFTLSRTPRDGLKFTKARLDQILKDLSFLKVLELSEQLPPLQHQTLKRQFYNYTKSCKTDVVLLAYKKLANLRTKKVKQCQDEIQKKIYRLPVQSEKPRR